MVKVYLQLVYSVEGCLYFKSKKNFYFFVCFVKFCASIFRGSNVGGFFFAVAKHTWGLESYQDCRSLCF